MLLQLWAGVFYSLNKVFFCGAERSVGKRERMFRILAWASYLVGMPAWFIWFVLNHNLMLAGAEAGGAAAMVLGIITAVKGQGKEPLWLPWVARVSAGVGFLLSVWYFRGFNSVSQALELTVIGGFLLGANLLAQERRSGYLWFVVMNGSNAVLQAMQGSPLLFGQQIMSIGFVLDAYRMSGRKQAEIVVHGPRNT